MKKVILDCDNTMGKPYAEIDDGLTLLYILGRADLELLGITNCYANASLQDVEYWTKRLLHDIDRTEIPRFSGKPFAGQNSSEWFARTWGHHFLTEKQTEPGPSAAARFLVEQADRYPGQIHILALGSMTNLLEASDLDPDFFSKVAQIALMGGVLGDLQLRGRPCRELNLACNPAGAYRVFTQRQCPVVVMNANICLDAPFNDADMGLIEFWPERRKEMVREWLGVFEGTFYLWDLLPAVYLSYPGLFDLETRYLASTLEDLHQGLLKPAHENEGAPVIMPGHILDPAAFMQHVVDGWQRAWEAERSGWGR